VREWKGPLGGGPAPRGEPLRLPASMAAQGMGRNVEGTKRLFHEIFHETSSGDFGIQVKNGPLFRCHTSILNAAGGFCGKVRQFGKMQGRSADHDLIPQPQDYFKQKGYARLLEDMESVKFSQPKERQSNFSKMMSGAANVHEDPMKPGWSSAHFIGGTTGANKRADPFFLSERYEVDVDCELMAELLRFVYQGHMSFFDLQPDSDKGNEVLTHKMLTICYDAEKFSVDALYEQLLEWFGKRSYFVVGEENFADAFYHLQHFEHRATEEHSRTVLVKTVTGDMLANREQFRCITRDPRWCSLPVKFVESILRFDGMPIQSETEVLTLIDRWNANANQEKKDIVKLLACFRPNEETRASLKTWLQLMGWMTPNGRIVDMPGLQGLEAVVSGVSNKGKKPRTGRKILSEVEQARLTLMTGDTGNKGAESVDMESVFLQYQGSRVVAKGSSFQLGANQKLLQGDCIRDAGIKRLRVAMSEPNNGLWNPEHEVFIGATYGEGRYFGYICSATAFSGIFAVRALASAAPAPAAPVHLTGAGNKVEFDLALEVQLSRVDLISTCKLSIIFNNETITEEKFQISHATLTDGHGLRFQVVGTGLGKDKVLVNLAWVGGGGASVDKEVVYGPIGFVEADAFR